LKFPVRQFNVFFLAENYKNEFFSSFENRVLSADINFIADLKTATAAVFYSISVSTKRSSSSSHEEYMVAQKGAAKNKTTSL